MTGGGQATPDCYTRETEAYADFAAGEAASPHLSLRGPAAARRHGARFGLRAGLGGGAACKRGLVSGPGIAVLLEAAGFSVMLSKTDTASGFDGAASAWLHVLARRN